MNDDKELRIDSLESDNAELTKQFADLKAIVLSIQQKQNQCSPCAMLNAIPLNSYSVAITDNISLQQNIPNPFNNATSISYTLPQRFTSAQIVITDKNGKTLKSITIQGSGKGIINVDASTLASGAYQYSLIVDGNFIDTKQMMLLK